jgi:uncharacterized protein (DUF433 family)
MAELDSITAINWIACELIEQVPGKVSGRPVVRGTRVMPDPIVNSYDLGDRRNSCGISHAFDRSDKAVD